MESNNTKYAEGFDAIKMAYYEDAVSEEKEEQNEEELSCNQLLKNLIKTNLRLLKMNDITFLMF